MALLWTDLTAKEQAAALAWAQAARDNAAKQAAVDAAKATVDAEQAKWRADAEGMSKATYLAARATRDAAVATKYAAYLAAQGA